MTWSSSTRVSLRQPKNLTNMAVTEAITKAITKAITEAVTKDVSSVKDLLLDLLGSGISAKCPTNPYNPGGNVV